MARKHGTAILFLSSPPMRPPQEEEASQNGSVPQNELKNLQIALCRCSVQVLCASGSFRMLCCACLHLSLRKLPCASKLISARSPQTSQQQKPPVFTHGPQRSQQKPQTSRRKTSFPEPPARRLSPRTKHRSRSPAASPRRVGGLGDGGRHLGLLNNAGGFLLQMMFLGVAGYLEQPGSPNAFLVVGV